MKTLVYVLILWAASVHAAGAAGEDPCTNGSFEQLDARGFPADWEAVGQSVTVSKDAHSGRHALRMVRTAETKTPETGLNRAWRARSGQRGAMIDRLQGGMDFWYKAVSAEGDTRLQVCAIPMSADPLENTGAARVIFDVPHKHVGDGQWHHDRLAYDFTDNAKVKWVHFAARIVGRAGELLLDDVNYVARTGPILQFGRIHIEEDPDKPGRAGTLKARIANVGDQGVRNLRVRVQCPTYLKTTPAEFVIGHLGVRDYARAVWRLEGTRDKPCVLPITAAAAEAAADAQLRITPRLVVESFGAVSPIALPSEPIVFECVARNPGNAIVTRPAAKLLVGRNRRARPMETEAREIPPGKAVRFHTTMDPGGESLDAWVSVKADNAPTESTYPGRSGGRHGVTHVRLTEKVNVPAPSGKPRAWADKECALLENRHIRMVLDLRSTTGYLMAATPAGWKTVAWISPLFDVKSGGKLGGKWQAGPNVSAVAENGILARIKITCSPTLVTVRTALSQSRSDELTASFELGPDDKAIRAVCVLRPLGDAYLFTFRGPRLFVADRREAVYPGLEWLIDDEVSSSCLDIRGDHPHRLRYVVHPNMVTIPAIGVCGKYGTAGILWDPGQKWDSRRTRPATELASPARLFRNFSGVGDYRSHAMQLFLPSVPEFVPPDRRLAEKPYPMKKGSRLSLRFRLYADGRAKDALSIVDEYIRQYGLPKPRPLPHGTWDGEIAFSMRAYLKSLWDAETKQWWTSKGGHPLMSKLARPRGYVMDLLRGAEVAEDEKLRKACRDRAREVLALIGPRADPAMADPSAAAGLLATRRSDGSWRFDADRKDQGVFKGADYSELGPHDAVEVGTCARNAFLVLRYARIAGDYDTYERMKKTLVLMQRFRVPRAAQVWEVPVHTPDLLAAADAVDAYMEAYRFCGERRWLDNAVLWARRGLPFIYLWDDPDKPWLLGASIPVFGATWYRGSWFGRPVQWNGLRYANALLSVAEHDQSLPWKSIAELIIRSAVWQQESDPHSEHVALWQDWIDAVSGQRCGWKFAPRQIIRNILKLTGRDEDPRTVIVGRGRERLHLSAVAPIDNARWDRDKKTLTFRVMPPRGQQGVVLVSPAGRPTKVTLNGTTASWQYDAPLGYLSIRVAQAGATEVHIEGAAFRLVEPLPRPVDRIAFEFKGGMEGWLGRHDIDRLRADRGAIVGRILGRDPYVIRPMLRVSAANCPVVRIRMRLSAGRGASLYWLTDTSPHWGEDKVLHFPVRDDGKWHEYVLRPSAHAMWKGKITALRIDPANGAASGDFAIDYVRGGAPGVRH